MFDLEQLKKDLIEEIIEDTKVPADAINEKSILFGFGSYFALDSIDYLSLIGWAHMKYHIPIYRFRLSHLRTVETWADFIMKNRSI
jgi:acyl carrier protein